MTKRTYPLPLALAVNYAAMMSLAVAVNLIPVFLTTLSHDLGGAHGLSNEQLGRIAAVTFIGLVAGVLITGPLADRFGMKRFAILGNVLACVGLGILGLAPNYLTVLCAVAVLGFGAGALDMVLSPIVCALQPERRTAAMNWLHSFYCVGALLTVFVSTLALRYGLGWRALALWMMVLPALVVVGFIGMHVPPLIAVGQQRTRGRELCMTPYFLAALAAIFLAGSTELGIAQWLPAYVERSLQYSKWTGGMALLAFYVAMTLARMLAGLLGKYVRPFTLMAWCCWASVVLFLLACFSPWHMLALLASVAVGFTGSCLWPSLLGVTADRFPQGGASMFALLGATGNVGGIFMPWIVGLIADHAALKLGIATSTLCPLCMAFILLWMRKEGKRGKSIENNTVLVS